MVAGPPGRSGLCATAAVGVGTKNAHGPVPTQRHSTAVPSAKGRVCRRSPVPRYAQVNKPAVSFQMSPPLLEICFKRYTQSLILD